MKNNHGRPAKKPIDADLADRLRQFQVVCKIAIQLKLAGSSASGIKRVDRISLYELGAREFGLKPDHLSYCIGRAQNFLADVRNAERVRHAAKFKHNPTPFLKAA